MTDSAAIIPPPLDLISSEAQATAPTSSSSIPALPPIPPTPPALNQTMKTAVRNGQAVTQETRIQQSIYPGMPVGGSAFSALETPGTQKKHIPCIEYIGKLSNDPSGMEFQIEISRTGPAVYEGQRLPFGVIERFCPPAPYTELFGQIRELHGGGSYKLRVLNGEGTCVHQMPFQIDMLLEAPKVRPLPGTGTVNSMFGTGMRSFGGGPMGAVADGATEDVMQLRKEEQRYRAEESTMLAKARVDSTKRDLNRQRQQDIESDERRINGPVDESRRAVDTLRSDMREQKYQDDMRWQQMTSGLDKLAMALSQQPKSNDSMQFMAQMIQSQTAMMTALLQSKNGGGSDMAEAMKLANESQKTVMQMAIGAATAGAAKSEKFLELLLTRQMESPENAVKQALDIRKATRDETLDMVNMMREFHEPAEPLINPEGGFWGNLGNVILGGLNSMVSGAARGGGMKAVEAIAGALGKPGQTQFSQPELTSLAKRMEAAELTRRGALPLVTPPPATYQLPGPMPAQAPAPQQRPRQMPRIFDKVYEIDDGPDSHVLRPTVPQWNQPPQQAPVAVQAPQPQLQPSVHVLEETVEEVAVVAAVPGNGSAPASSRVGELVNEAVEMALDDLKSGRQEHDWVDFALGKWGNLIRDLRGLPDDTARLELLQQHTDPALFNELLALLMDAKNPQYYQQFIDNLHALLEESAGVVTNAA